MANTKEVNIIGLVPFNLHDTPEIARKMAYMASPCSGLKLEYVGVAGYEPNEFGGKTTFYSFVLSGRDSVSWAWIDGLVEDIKKIGGRITQNKVIDIDA